MKDKEVKKYIRILNDMVKEHNPNIYIFADVLTAYQMLLEETDGD